MKVVIIGAGEVGFHVAKALSEEDYDITVVDIDHEKCQRASENLDVIVVEGNGASPKILLEARVSEADYVLCLTRVDEINLIASQQSHELGANKVIARLRDQQYSSRDSIIKPEKFGVDMVIHPEQEACREIVQLMKYPYAVQARSFEGGRLTMVGIRIDRWKKLLLDNKTLSEICKANNRFRFTVVAVLRDNESIVPNSEFKFREGDIAHFVLKSKNIDNLLELLNITGTNTNTIMILGGSKIGRTLAEVISKDHNVRLIDYNRPKAGKISTKLDNTMVVYGDGTDIEFLKAENIQDVDSFVAVTENEKTNLIAGMLANHLGARQSIIHVVNTEYMPTIKEIGFGAVISKNLSTANSILRKLHSDISDTSVATFHEIGLDAYELQPEEGSEITTKPLNALNLPKDSIIGMINHHGKIGIAHGNSQLTEEDIALVFAKPSGRSKINKMFVS
ncbi:MAG: Trk system potassium transport protein TrkA [Flavobacteriaceae bacterium TMED184]|nr:MAG: Trk system potassium transport protein TrkA [Flavobacteriaceae bacterium TMED184]|tara:strand:- start:33085 stop:34437 length:1353 start_codon:yes stop_codon:yes gene_type:complete